MKPIKPFALGARLIQLRTRCRLSQEQVAQAVGVRQTTYASWEGDKTVVKSTHLPALAQVFNVSIRELLPPDHSTHPARLNEQPGSDDAPIPGPRDELINLQRRLIQQLETELVDLRVE